MSIHKVIGDVPTFLLANDCPNAKSFIQEVSVKALDQEAGKSGLLPADSLSTMQRSWSINQ